MATLVSALEWNYVATINEEGMLGGVESFIRNAKMKSPYDPCQKNTEIGLLFK